MGKLKIEITADSANPNNLRVHYQGAQLCKVYGWTPEDAQKRAEMLAAALRIAARVLDEGAVEGLARVIYASVFGASGDEMIHHPAQSSWEEPSMPRWMQLEESAQAVITYLKGEGHD